MLCKWCTSWRTIQSMLWLRSASRRLMESAPNEITNRHRLHPICKWSYIDFREVHDRQRTPMLFPCSRECRSGRGFCFISMTLDKGACLRMEPTGVGFSILVCFKEAKWKHQLNVQRFVTLCNFTSLWMCEDNSCWSATLFNKLETIRNVLKTFSHGNISTNTRLLHRMIYSWIISCEKVSFVPQVNSTISQIWEKRKRENCHPIWISIKIMLNSSSERTNAENWRRLVQIPAGVLAEGITVHLLNSLLNSYLHLMRDAIRCYATGNPHFREFNSI